MDGESSGNDYNRPERVGRPSYNETLAPTCMIWLMFIGLAVIASIIIIWMIANSNKL